MQSVPGLSTCMVIAFPVSNIINILLFSLTVHINDPQAPAVWKVKGSFSCCMTEIYIICLNVGLFGFILVGYFSFLNLYVCFPLQLGKFGPLFLQINFLLLSLFTSHSGIPIMYILKY